MKRQSLSIGIALALAGCATAPLPDGGRIDRLPAAESAATAPALSPEESQRLAQLNAQILAEQHATREREAAEEAWRRAQQQWAFDLQYGHPGWYGWHDGRRHHQWSYGLGWYGPWPYGPWPY